MFDRQNDSGSISHFDLLCESLEDYEHLPEVAPAQADASPFVADQDHAERIEGEILAGLVHP